MAPVLLLAAPVLEAPADPGTKGLLVTVALILLGGLVAAHVRLLRAVSRAAAAGAQAQAPVRAAGQDAGQDAGQKMPTPSDGSGPPGQPKPIPVPLPGPSAVDDPVGVERR